MCSLFPGFLKFTKAFVDLCLWNEFNQRCSQKFFRGGGELNCFEFERNIHYKKLKISKKLFKKTNLYGV